MNRHLKAALCIPFLVASCAFAGGNNYKNFDVATYATVRDVVLMNDPAYLESPLGRDVEVRQVRQDLSRDQPGYDYCRSGEPGRREEVFHQQGIEGIWRHHLDSRRTQWCDVLLFRSKATAEGDRYHPVHGEEF